MVIGDLLSDGLRRHMGNYYTIFLVISYLILVGMTEGLLTLNNKNNNKSDENDLINNIESEINQLKLDEALDDDALAREKITSRRKLFWGTIGAFFGTGVIVGLAVHVADKTLAGFRTT